MLLHAVLAPIAGPGRDDHLHLPSSRRCRGAERRDHGLEERRARRNARRPFDDGRRPRCRRRRPRDAPPVARRRRRTTSHNGARSSTSKACRGRQDAAEFSLKVREGEILGITGPEGAGKSELLRTIFGLMPPTRGTVSIDGKTIDGRSPSAMLNRGVAFVPEDRFAEGVLLDRNIEENISLPKAQLREAVFSSDEPSSGRKPSRRRPRSKRRWRPSIRSSAN